MKRSIKNVLMVAVIALLSMGMVFTYCYAKKHITDNTFDSMNGGTSPSMPNDMNSSKNANSITWSYYLIFIFSSLSIALLVMSLTNSSSYEGSINKDNGAKSISLTLDKTSNLKLTGDSYITSLINEDSSNSNIDFNGYKLYVNGVAIN